MSVYTVVFKSGLSFDVNAARCVVGSSISGTAFNNLTFLDEADAVVAVMAHDVWAAYHVINNPVRTE